MQDLLKYFGVGYEALSRRNQALQEKLRIILVRVRAPTRYIGILESIKIKLHSPGQSQGSSAQCPP